MKKTTHRKSRRKSPRGFTRKPRQAGLVRDAKRDPKTGYFGQGNNLAQKADGVNRFLKKKELPEDVRAEVDAFMGEVISNQGGIGECTGIRGGYVRNLGTVDALVQLAVKDVRTNGIYTERGHVRQMVLTLLQFLDRWDRYAQRLGMERRTKQVESIEDFIREHEGAQQV